MLVGNLLRAIVVLVVAAITAAGNSDLWLGAAVLVALGINRFILAGLSAALPHTVPERALVTANAFAPTTGTLFAALGGLLGVVAWTAAGGNDRASVMVLLVAAAGFALSGLLALRIQRNLLGPDGDIPQDTFTEVVDGLRDGTVALWRARPAFQAVMVVTVQRIAFGVLTVLAILMLRNTLNPPSEPEKALSQLTLVVGAAAIGWGIGAIITPQLTRMFGAVRWSLSIFFVAGVITPIGAGVIHMAGLITGAAFLGLAGAAVKITADTFVQEFVRDEYRGRVFSIYDVVVNIGLVTGVVIAAFGSPISAEAPLLLVFVGLLVTTASVIGLWRNGRITV